MEFKQGSNQFARIVVIHLYTILQQEMGLKSPIFEELGHLGIKDKIVA